MKVLQLLGGFAMLAALLAIEALALYVLARIVLIAVSYVPMVGRKHRHDDWDRLNQSHYPEVCPSSLKSKRSADGSRRPW